ncbi:MAG: adenosylmethionine decarboxylase [Alphaproteobacteria bacterium]|nr:adenosylmethionine decarboxylase [Alphaproteobacteria bacterium]
MSSVIALKKEGFDLHPNSKRTHAASHSVERLEVVPSIDKTDERKDFLIEREGERYAGMHLLIDLKDASHLDDIAHIDQAMRDCVTAAGATLLHIHLHHFTPNGGVSGVAVLAESHISIHTWPEYGYAALDVFMCGAAEPHKAIDVLRRAFQPGKVEVEERPRGRGL